MVVDVSEPLGLEDAGCLNGGNLTILRMQRGSQAEFVGLAVGMQVGRVSPRVRRTACTRALGARRVCVCVCKGAFCAGAWLCLPGCGHGASGSPGPLFAGVLPKRKVPLNGFAVVLHVSKVVELGGAKLKTRADFDTALQQLREDGMTEVGHPPPPTT